MKLRTIHLRHQREGRGLAHLLCRMGERDVMTHGSKIDVPSIVTCKRCQRLMAHIAVSLDALAEALRSEGGKANAVDGA